MTVAPQPPQTVVTAEIRNGEKTRKKKWDYENLSRWMSGVSKDAGGGGL